MDNFKYKHFVPNKKNIVKYCVILNNKRRWQTWPFTPGHKCNDNFSHKLRKTSSTIQEIIRYPGEIRESNKQTFPFTSFEISYSVKITIFLKHFEKFLEAFLCFIKKRKKRKKPAPITFILQPRTCINFFENLLFNHMILYYFSDLEYYDISDAGKRSNKIMISIRNSSYMS